MARYRAIFVAGASTMTLAFASVAQAQAQGQAGPSASGTTAGSSAAQDEPAAGEIVVTANKREQRASDVGMAITALSGQTLATKGINSSQDLAKVVPALTVASAADGTPIYTLRGVGFNSANLGAQPTVSVYLDQAALPYGPMTEGPLFDLERLEVLKGPQGTLFGQNSTGGAINYIANKPTDTLKAGISLDYGRFNTVQVDGYVSGPLSDTLKARAAFSVLNSGDWQYDYTRVDGIGAQKKYAARLIFDWKPTDRLSVELDLNGWIDKSDNQIPQFISASPRVASQASPLLFAQPAAPQNDRAADWDPNHSFARDNRMGQAILRADYTLSDRVTLTSLSNYEYVRIKSPFDNDGTQYTFGYVTTRGYVEAFNQELRLAGKFGGATVTIGANYGDDHSQEYDDQDFGGLLSSTTNVAGTGLNILNNENRGHQTNKSGAVFGNLEYKITPELTLTGGVRYTDQKHTNQACSADTGPGDFSTVINTLFGAPITHPGGCISLAFDGTAFTAPFPLQSFKEHNVSWRAGIDYKPTRDLLVYGLVSRGFKAGNYPVINATARAQFDPVKQEQLTAYEGGIKASLLDRMVQLNVSGYYYDYRNKQLLTNTTDPIFGLLPILANVPKSHVTGFDADVAITPVRGLTIRGALAYADSKIGSFQGFDAFNTPANLTGKAFNFAPKWTSTADIEYRYPATHALDVVIGGDMTYNSTTYADLAQTPSLRIAPYTIFGLRAGLSSSDGRWSAMAWAKNVTNKYYWYNAQVGYDSIWRLTGMPATYGLTLSYKM